MRRLSNLLNRSLQPAKGAVRALTSYMPQPVSAWAAKRALASYHFVEEASRMRSARLAAGEVPRIESYDGEVLPLSVLSREEPWARLPHSPCTIPGMLTVAEERYYAWITKFYSGVGSVIEIGTFLGRSTWIILTGLLQNPQFADRRLYAYDGFTWYPSMEKWVKDAGLQRLPAAGESFEQLFRDYTAGIADHIVCQRVRLGRGSNQCDQSLPELSWCRPEKIELAFIDCGSGLEVNEGWFRCLEPFFIPNRTLVVMQDWHFKGPYRSWVHTKHFTDLHADRMLLLHEVTAGGIGCFLYTPSNPTRWTGIV